MPLLLSRATLLTELGREEEAKSTYLQAIARAPTDYDVLHGFGRLLQATGYLSAARTIYLQAIAHHPHQAPSYTSLASILYRLNELEQARVYYCQALELDPDQFEAHRGLSYVLRELGDEDAAKPHRDHGFASHSMMVLPYRGDGEPIPVLQLISARGGNIPIEQFLDDRVYAITVIAAEYFDLNRPLPPHRLFINTIADADLCRDAVRVAEQIVTRSAAPVINQPIAVAATSRVGTAELLGRLPGVIAPKILTLPRELLAAPDSGALLSSEGFSFPVLIRTPGFHTGQNFVRVEAPDQLTRTISTLPGRELMVIEYLDARGRDGKSRKYRVMMIGGELYPLHLAIYHDWKIHYFSADMANSAEHRAEDAAFLTNMPQTLGDRAMQALVEIQRQLRLDFAGIDFGLNRHGEVLLFEANAAMNVLSPGPDARWDYRRPHVEKIRAATRRLFWERAMQSGNLM